MNQIFEIGDVVRKKTRGRKMIVSFIYSHFAEGFYKSVYESLKMANPQSDFFYACRDFQTGKQIEMVFPEDILERIDKKKTKE